MHATAAVPTFRCRRAGATAGPLLLPVTHEHEHSTHTHTHKIPSSRKQNDAVRRRPAYAIRVIFSVRNFLFQFCARTRAPIAICANTQRGVRADRIDRSIHHQVLHVATMWTIDDDRRRRSIDRSVFSALTHHINKCVRVSCSRLGARGVP